MLGGDLTLTDGASVGAWIKPRLGGDFGAVTLQVPRDFEAYARVLHPAWDTDGNRIRWAEVARSFGTTAHREMQWHAIRGLADADELQISIGDEATDPPWTGRDPEIGSPNLDDLDALCAILASHTADPTRCFFGLCTIESWEDNFTRNDLDRAPLLRLPDGRDHIVLDGSLSAIDQIIRDWTKPSPSRAVFSFVEEGSGPPAEPDPEWLRVREAPNLIWPADRSWLVCSEVDFDSTLVGGSAALIAAIVASPELEAWQVEPTDSLAATSPRSRSPWSSRTRAIRTKARWRPWSVERSAGESRYTTTRDLTGALFLRLACICLDMQRFGNFSPQVPKSPRPVQLALCRAENGRSMTFGAAAQRPGDGAQSRRQRRGGQAAALIGHTDGGRPLTLELAIDPTTLLTVASWPATARERRIIN